MTERRVAWWAGAAAVWTFIAWGNRIGLLTGDEASDPWTWIRVGGSLLFGVALAVIAVVLWAREAAGALDGRRVRRIRHPDGGDLAALGVLGSRR